MNIAVTTTDDLPDDLAVVQTFDRVRDAFPAEAVTVDVAVKADDVRKGPPRPPSPICGRRPTATSSCSRAP
jgi:hypothetical protein